MSERVQTTSLLDAAVGYASRGWRVFPLHYVRPGGSAVRCSCGDGTCGNVGKHPRTDNGLHDATDDVNAIRTFWERTPMFNVGIATGAGSGFIVIDVDVRKGGDETLADLLDEHGQFEPTVETYTGGGGRHILFAHPGVRIRNNSDGKLGRGLDVRGDGGYIVAPPSGHLRGVYRWREWFGPDDVPFAEMPSWLIDRLIDHEHPAAHPNITTQPNAGRHWLRKAIERADPDHRNDGGWWLACQLRDAGVGLSESETLLVEYQQHMPAGEHAYTEKEAIASARSAYKTGQREPAKSDSRRSTPTLKIGTRTLADSLPTELTGNVSASKELRDFYAAVAAGTIYNVPLPWPVLTRLTQALLPASIMMLCGEPGVGKTFWTLQELIYWYANGVNADVFFIEKDRLFHTRRLLALLEGDRRLTELDWIKNNHDGAVRNAMDRHGDIIDELGTRIHSRPGGRISLEDLIAWMKQRCDAGSRVMVIDPITAAFAGAERWLADDDFVTGAQDIVRDYGASLVLVTHPRKGKISGRASTGHDMGGGAAFHRFVDTVVWLQSVKKGKRFSIQTAHGPTTCEPDVIAHLMKTRDGTGGGLQLAMKFGGNALHFREEGVIERETSDVQDVA